MGEERRAPRGGFLLMVVLLVGSVAGSAWWLSRPAPATGPAGPADDPDVFCSGRVDAAGPVVALEPAQAGRVAAVGVAEGDPVAAGQEVLRLDDSAAKIRLAQADAALAAARVELDAAAVDRARYPNQLAARAAMAAAASARVEAARKMLQQRRDQHQVTPLGRAEGEALEAQVRELEQIEAAEARQVEDAKALDSELRVRLARAKVQAAEADRALAAKAVAECVVAAPGPGTVLRVQAAAGMLLAPGSPAPAVVFAPAGPPVVRAEVDQEALGKVAEGQRVEVQDENRPDGPVLPGRVRQVARWVAQRRAYVLEPGEVNDVRTVECVVDLDPPAAGLWVGQRMRVRFVRAAGGRPPAGPGAGR